MESYIVYRSERLSALSLAFDPGQEFRSIVDQFGEIAYPDLRLNPELVSFAILELVSNSIRAHKERGIADEVQVTLAMEEGEFRVTVTDSGRGFDPGRLPYDLDAPAETVDVMSEAFLEYRERYGSTRFGMGLYVAKKTFPRFRLRFVDGGGNSCPWYSGMVKGTRIDLAYPLGGGDGVEDIEAVATLEEAGA